MADETTPAPAPEEIKTEPFRFEIHIGQRTVKTVIELDQPSSAIALASTMGMLSFPHCRAIGVCRETTGEYIVRMPLMGVMQKLAPEINRAAGGSVIPIVPIANESTIQDLVKNQRKMRGEQPPRER